MEGQHRQIAATAGTVQVDGSILVADVRMGMQNTDITFDVRNSRVEEGYLPQRNSAAELNEHNRQTDEEIALAAAFGGHFKEEGYGEE